MNKSIKTKGIIITVLFTFIASMPFVVAPLAHAEDMNVAACMSGAISGRFKDFGKFLLDQISFDGLLGDIIDPWQDALFTNECQAYDLFALVDRRDELERAIRNAYLACKFEDLEVQKKMYNHIVAEIYYVRNVVDRFKLFWMPNILKYAIYEKYLANTILDPEKNHAKIKQAFIKKFKKRFPDEKELEQLYYDVSLKYAQREATYIICDENPLMEVWTKLVEFGQFWGFVPCGDTPDCVSLWDQAEDAWDSQVGFAAKNVVAYGTELGKMFDVPKGSARDAWLSHLEINVNDVDITGLLASNPEIVNMTKEELEEKFGDEASQIYDQLRPFRDAKDKKDYTQDTFNTILKTLNDREKADQFMLETSAQNEVEYLFSDANSFVFVEQLTRLDQVINDSYAALDAIKDCSEKTAE